MVELYEKIPPLNPSHYIYVLIPMLLISGLKDAYCKTQVKMSESLSKSICMRSASFSTSKQIQPALNNKAEFQHFSGCQFLLWNKCESSDCKKFEKLPNPSACSSTGEDKDPQKGDSKAERIIGGQEADPHEFPYQVNILNFDGESFCGGAIYNDKYIITAAHCVVAIPEKNFDPMKLIVVVGDHDFRKPNSLKQTFAVDTIFVHENYQLLPRRVDNDVAVVRLNQSMTFNAGVQPILMPRANSKPCGHAIVTGWGMNDITSFIPMFPDVLHKVTVPIIPFNKCQESYNAKNTTLLTNTFCAGTRGKGMCNGDSGGPIAKKIRNGSYVLLGLVSYSEGCATPRFPGVYVDVAQFLTWILSKIV